VELVRNIRKGFEIDPISGRFILPPLETIVDQLYQRQGNILVFLRDFAGDKLEDEPRRQQLLFEIRFAMKGDEQIEQKWALLLQLHQESHTLLAEANLVNVLSQAQTANEKPERLLSILERLNPERWAKRSVSKKKTESNPYEDTLNA
jgi:hypothetical protein